MNLWQRLDALFARVPDKWGRMIGLVSLMATVPATLYMAEPFRTFGDGRGYPVILFAISCIVLLDLFLVRKHLRDPVNRRWTFMLAPLFPLFLLAMGVYWRLELG